MATSVFKSTTKRSSIGGSSYEERSNRAIRRSRSLSRFPRPVAAEPEAEEAYNKNVPRGKFVNTTRGSGTPFPEISLDDLALEFFSSSSRNESDGGVVETKEREGRSVSRRDEIGRWASDTASSRRRGRSVSRPRGNVTSNSAASGEKKLALPDAGSRRRRSLSVARYQISDSESEVDHFQNSSNCANVKAPISGSNQRLLTPKSTVSSNRRLGRSQSQKDLSSLRDGYSSHSSALTDDESKDTRFGKNGFEKIIRAVYAQKKTEHPAEDAGNGELYETMRKELRYAVEEIRTELNQAMGKNHTPAANGDSLQSENSDGLQNFSRTREKYATKLEQLEKRKQDLIKEMLLEQRQGRDISRMVKELPNSRTASIEKPSRARKKSSDRTRMSRTLTEEAERYFEDFIVNVEDTDISSFDGERSDGSSTLGGTVKTREAAETYKTPPVPSSRPVEMDGVVLPWLQWETSHDGSVSGKNKPQTPATPKALQWDSEKDMVQLPGSGYSISSHGSWSPGLFSASPLDRKDDTCKTGKIGSDYISYFDADEYLRPQNNEEVLFEMYRERNRIALGGLLLCTGALY